MKKTAIFALMITSSVGFFNAADAAVLVADYQFNGNLNSSIGGAPSLVAIDPTNSNAFGANGYSFGGTTTPSQQGGLSLNVSGLVPYNSYSIYINVAFDTGNNAWRRLVDVQNRQSDNGFYVNPGNNLEIYPIANTSGGFTTGDFHQILLTVASDGTVKGYLDGGSAQQVLSTNTNIMNIDYDPANNPDHLVNFFVDNVVAGGQGEWSAGTVREIKLYDGVVTFDTIGGVPEPSTWAMMMVGFAGLGYAGYRKRKTVPAAA